MVTFSRSLNRETKDGTLRQSIAAWCLSDDFGLDSSNSRQFFHRAGLSPFRCPLAVAQATTNSIRPRRFSAVVGRLSHSGIKQATMGSFVASPIGTSWIEAQ